MIRKIIISIVFSVFTIGMAVGMVLGEINNIVGISSVGGAFFGLLLPYTFEKIQDCTDVSQWQVSLRKLLRGKIIKKETLIRISFAYLYRIKVDDKYLLVKNARGTQKFQPIGGAYKYNKSEKMYLAKEFYVVDDNKIPIDKGSRNDYRLYVPAVNLKKFIKRFNTTTDRENLSNLGREFSEELVKKGILDFSHIEYRYCGRHFTEVQYSRVFNCYELLLADIVEINLTQEQENAVREIMNKPSSEYYFATEKEIKSCGVQEDTDRLLETIADHTLKILQETEYSLEKNKKLLKTYSIDLI